MMIKESALQVNAVAAPTYYGSNPKPARIPIFSACCPAKATDLSVPYVKPNHQKDISGNKSPKSQTERDSREHHHAMAIVKTVAKQVRRCPASDRVGASRFVPTNQICVDARMITILPNIPRLSINCASVRRSGRRQQPYSIR